MLIQNMSLNPRARESRSAVSALMPRLPCTISLIRRGGTSIVLAIRYCEIASGSRNSVLRISPGWVGAKSAIGLSFLVVVDEFLVVVDEFDVAGAAATPCEADAPLVVDANAVLAGAGAGQLLQSVARRHPEVVDALSGVDESQLVVCEPAEFPAELLDVAALPDRLSVLIPERADHGSMITLDVINVKRYERSRTRNSARSSPWGELQWWNGTHHEGIP